MDLFKIFFLTRLTHFDKAVDNEQKSQRIAMFRTQTKYFSVQYQTKLLMRSQQIAVIGTQTN